jgi:protein-S-isoprenylcysteine O-methyltransferase Ste14
MQENEKGRRKTPSYLKIMAPAYVASFGAVGAIFLFAGRISYWQGWVFGAFYLGLVVTMSVLFVDKRDLIRERLKPGPGTKWWDRIFFAFYLPTAVGIIVVGALDGGRFGWTGPLPMALYIVSYAVLVLSCWGFLWAMCTNKFFSRAVRIQTERGHYVVQDGPYRFVRHPGYLAGIFMLISMPVALGSVWGLIPAGAAVVLIIVRTYLEDRTLKKELAGYAEYAQRVKFRLLPHIW